MLLTQQLCFAYTPQQQFVFPDLSCQSGEALLLLGQSGTGKTTLLHLLGGLLRPQQGNIFINQTNICQLSPAQLDRYRGQHIGIVFQKSHFIASLTTLENLLVAQRLLGKTVEKNTAQQLLHNLGLQHKAHTYPNQLSQGEQQRAALARALMLRPLLLLADEPTSGLDDHNCALVAQMLRQHATQTGSALVIVTHDYRLTQQFDRHISLQFQHAN